ncbi:MAG TPA: VCBS repeat-containing protein [Pyrinomonadaceae bacterium]|jgi:hypothetical protein
MKKILFMVICVFVVLFNISALQASAQTLLNEIDINPPGEDRPCEYIEIRGTPGAILNNLYFAVIEGDATAAGDVDFLVNLNGRTIGSNGLLIITGTTPCPNRFIPAQTTQVTDARLNEGGSGIENGANSFLLISSPLFLTETDYDTDNDGTLDGLPVGATIIDGIGWIQKDFLDVSSTIYGDATLFLPAGTPDAATRFPADATANSVRAWYYGDLNPTGGNGSVTYNSASVSSNFPAGGMLTPGAPNVGILTRTVGRQFDFDGDGKSDFSVYRPDNGVWYLLNSMAGFSAVRFGISTDKLVPADYDGDGKTDVAVWRDGVWYLQRSNAGFAAIQFGSPGDIPAPADFTGDGRAELAVYRPSNGFWYTLDLVNNTFAATRFGAAEDKPVVADYDGDLKADYAVYRPSEGIWYLLRSSAGFSAVRFGISTDKPVVGDYDGDGRADQAVFRSETRTWYLLRSSRGFAATQFGIETDVPTPADYDGDGKTDIAVFRRGIWHVLKSSNEQFFGVQFGVNTDAPLPAAFVP